MKGLDYSHHYKKWHSYSPEHIHGMLHYNRFLLRDILPKDPDSRILDIGCGMGFALLYFKSRGFSLAEGIDTDPRQIQACREKGLQVHLVEDAVRFLKDRPSTYALITAFDVIEHLPREEQVELTQAIHAALISQGALVCTVPNANSTLASRYRYVDYTHCTSFTECSLEFLLFNAGFRDIRVSAVDCFNRPSHRHFWRKEYFRWWLFKALRGIRRLQMIAELGYDEGGGVPLSLNLKGVARKSG